MQLSFCHFSLCLLNSMQLKFYFRLGSRVVNVKSIIFISSHWWMFSSWYECIFPVSFPHISNSWYCIMSVQYYRFSREENAISLNLFSMTQSFGFNSSLFWSLIPQFFFKMLFDNHVSLLMAYPKNYSCCCENCTCLHLLKAAVILTNIRYLLLNYLCSFLLNSFWGFIFIFECFLKSFTTTRTSYL